jgi:hypothetical protein
MNDIDWSSPLVQLGYLVSAVKGALFEMKIGRADNAEPRLRDALAQLHQHTGNDLYGEDA